MISQFSKNEPRYAISPLYQPPIHEMIKRTLLIALQTSVALAAKTFGGE
jgi:hypothetical protein